MKVSLLAYVLLTGLATVSCHKADDVTPQRTQAQMLVGKWSLMQQLSTDGTTTHTGHWNKGDIVREFTSGGNYLDYSGLTLNFTYPYSLANGILTIQGASRSTNYTVTTLTSTDLVLVFSGAPDYPLLTFTNTYIRN